MIDATASDFCPIFADMHFSRVYSSILSDVHAAGVMHHDLRLENLLRYYDEDQPYLAIIDFHSSRIEDEV